MSFVGLRLLKAGGRHRLIAYLAEGVVELEPTDADLEREPGYYLNDWTPADPLAIADAGAMWSEAIFPDDDKIDTALNLAASLSQIPYVSN